MNLSGFSDTMEMMYLLNPQTTLLMIQAKLRAMVPGPRGTVRFGGATERWCVITEYLVFRAPLDPI